MSIYLGNTPIANTGYDKANTSLSNLTNTGKNIANWSNNVTNCITEIPQDIKLELNNGTLTLKAGSKVYKLDGTPITINTDISLATSYYGFNQPCLIFCDTLNNTLENPNTYICLSGSGYPTITTYQYMMYFDTTAKKYYWTSDNGTSWIERMGYSYPIAIATVGDSNWTSIDQVFNGFGYIGSTVFALPGVKGLIPNGRNADGSLKNIEVGFTKVITNTNTVKYSGDIAITTDYFDLAQGATYNEIDNKNYQLDGITYYGRCLAGKFVKGANGVVTSLTPKTAFHALDYNDSSTISGWAMPSSRYIDLTLGASGATYTAPANGWVFFQDTGNQPYSALVLRTYYIRVSLTPGSGGNTVMSEIMPVKKGDIFYAEYANITGENRLFRFIYAEGEN